MWKIIYRLVEVNLLKLILKVKLVICSYGIEKGEGNRVVYKFVMFKYFINYGWLVCEL